MTVVILVESRKVEGLGDDAILTSDRSISSRVSSHLSWQLIRGGHGGGDNVTNEGLTEYTHSSY